MDNRGYFELFIQNNFDTRIITNYLKRIDSPLNYSEAYGVAINFCNSYSKNPEDIIRMEKALDVYKNNELKELEIAKNIYEDIKNKVELKVISKKYDKSLSVISELFYKYSWYKIKNEKELMDITEKEEQILSRYLLYLNINNNFDDSIYQYKDIYTMGDNKDAVINFFKGVLNNYLTNPDTEYGATDKERMKLVKLNHVVGVIDRISYDELKKRYSKDRRKHLAAVNKKVEELLTSDEAVNVSSEFM